MTEVCRECEGLEVGCENGSCELAGDSCTVGTAPFRDLVLSAGGFGGSTFLNVIVASMSSPAKIVSSLNETKTRRLDGIDMTSRSVD